MSRARFFTRTQKLAAFKAALEYHQRAAAEWPNLSKAEKRSITETSGSILRTSFRPVSVLTIRPRPRTA